MAQIEGRGDPGPKPLPPAGPTAKPRGHFLAFQAHDLRTELYRLLGVDLSVVPGLGTLSLFTLFAEIGPDLRAFATDKHFCSWLRLCPHNRISGDKVLSSQTSNGSPRAARVFRMAAQSRWHSRSALGDYYRRMRAKLGAASANTATAHKLARIFYHLVTSGQAYDESLLAQEQERQRQRRERKLHREATALGYTLVPEGPVT